MRLNETKLNPYLERIRKLDFVKELEFKHITDQWQIGQDGLLKIFTPKGKFQFNIEHVGSYLNQTLLKAITSYTRNSDQVSKQPLLLFTRYVPQPSADLLMKNGVNFVDRAGNMYLALGNNYAHTVIGKKESVKKDVKILTQAGVQLLFTFAAYEQSLNWPVRQLAEASGVGKSMVAKIRNQLVVKGILRETATAFKIPDIKQLERELLRGYDEVLRPKLLIKRFRTDEPSTEKAIEIITRRFAEISLQWSLTGGPAAYELQHFYRGAEIPIFIDEFSATTLRQLRLLPDAQGPIILLQQFGTVTNWKVMADKPLAHPWLIYTELMCSADPRAHEAAKELKEEFLK